MISKWTVRFFELLGQLFPLTVPGMTRLLLLGIALFWSCVPEVVYTSVLIFSPLVFFTAVIPYSLQKSSNFSEAPQNLRASIIQNSPSIMAVFTLVFIFIPFYTYLVEKGLLLNILDYYAK